MNGITLELTGLWWTATWQSALLIGIVATVTKLFRPWLTPTWRALLWTIPLLRLTLLVVPATSWSLYQWVVPPASLVAGEQQPVASVARIAKDATVVSSEALDPGGKPPRDVELQVTLPSEGGTITAFRAGQVPASSQLVSSPSASSQPASSHSSARASLSSESLTTAFVTLWLGGVVALAVRWLHLRFALARLLGRTRAPDQARLGRIFSRCQRRVRAGSAWPGVGARLALSDDGIGPSVHGVLRPVIVLPSKLASSLSDDELEMVFLHEMAHVRRFDGIGLAVARLATTLHWFNPLAHFVSRRLRQECELAVDASTVARLERSGVFRYAELLIRLASLPRSQVGMVPMSASRSDLNHRVNHMFERRTTGRWQLGLAATLAAALLVTGLCDVRGQNAESPSGQTPAATPSSQVKSKPSNSPSPAEDPTAERPSSQPSNAVDDAASAPSSEVQTSADEGDESTGPAIEFSGHVVDSDGRPVGGAIVVVNEWGLTPRSVTDTTDPDGKFRLAIPDTFDSVGSKFIWAFADGHSHRVVNWYFREGESNDHRDIEIQLPAVDSMAVRVVGPGGQPVVGAKVFPAVVNIPNGTFMADDPTGLSGPPPAALAERLTVRTDADGRAELSGIPKPLLYSVSVRSPEYGEQRFARPEGELRLRPTGSIEGQVLDENPERFAGTTIRFESGEGFGRGGYALATVDEGGRYRVPTIATGKLDVAIVWDETLSVRPTSDRPPAIAAGETIRLDIRTLPTHAVVGKVVTSDTGEPVVGAKLSLRPVDNPLGDRDYVVTDQDGQYTARLIAGSHRRQLFSMGEGSTLFERYEYPETERISVAPSDESIALSTISLPVKKLVRGRLVDADGQPLSGRTIGYYRGVYRHFWGKAETEADGSFQMRIRNWERIQEDQLRRRLGRERQGWAMIERPAVGAEPPSLISLDVVDAAPEAMRLRLPKDGTPFPAGQPR